MTTVKICSALASDPDFVELLEEFISNIPERIRTIQTKFEASDRGTLCTLVHQLRGACGSYGFHDMTSLATDLEIGLRSDRELDELARQVETFLEACTRMTASAS